MSKTEKIIDDEKPLTPVEKTDTADLMTFELPGVTETAAEFIDVPETETPETGDTAEPSIPSESSSESDDAEKYRGTLSSKGKPFDPSIHKYPPEETPTTGNWKKKPKSQTQQEKATGAQSEPNVAYRKEAQHLALTYANSHMLLFGEDGKIENLSEVTPLIDAMEAYIQEKGFQGIGTTPGLILAMGNYTVGVCSRPSNAQRLRAWFSPVWSGIKGFFGFKPKKKKDDNIPVVDDAAKRSEPSPVESAPQVSLNEGVPTDHFEL